MTADSVFISYSQNDSQKARELASTLTKRGGNIWIDSINLVNLQAGQDEEEIIEEAILSSKFVAIITSPNALNDSLLKDEKEFARGNGKEVVLVKIAPCDIKKKMRWRRLQCIDLTNNWNQGVDLLLSKMDVSEGSTSVTTEQTDDIVEEVKKREPVAKTQEPIPAQEPSVSGDLVSLVKELRDDIDLYELALNNQIKSSYLGVKLLIACSILLLLGLYLIPDLKALLDSGEENLKYLSPIGGMIPSSLSTFSLNKIKEKKKRLSSLKICDRKLSRMENGLINYTRDDILGLEDEVFNYVNA